MPLSFRLLKRLDLHLLISIGLLVFFGLFILYSATFDQFADETSPLLFLIKQLIAFFLGTLFMFGATYMDYHFLEQYAEVFYFLLLSLLLIVINIGQASTGVQRWLYFGSFNIQPSEIAKLGVIIILAKFFANHKGSLNSFVEIFPALIIIGIPFLLIFKQPDLGTALMFIIIFLGMGYWAGINSLLLFLIISPFFSILIFNGISFHPWLFWGIYLLSILFILHYYKINLIDTGIFFGLNIMSGITFPLLWNSLQYYQQQRLLSFINPAIDPMALGTRYHTAKSVIAIGSGGIVGQGFLRGPLTHLHYIPEHHTDFIFTVIGEEFGLIGTLFIIFLLGYIIFRGLRIAVNAQDEFGSLLAIGIVSLLLF
ncbi:MAG: rod shape-determining protein RodA, partial [Candidatus Margulisbacteria bacterium]|nr:rod shape-determining protein RodA [Candidatus Margulisiibacteriota bacterium]